VKGYRGLRAAPTGSPADAWKASECGARPTLICDKCQGGRGKSSGRIYQHSTQIHGGVAETELSYEDTQPPLE